MRFKPCRLAGGLLLPVLLAFLLLAPPRPAMAAQGTTCLPVSGVVSGVSFATAINAALASSLSNFSGTTAPKPDCGGVAALGQWWLDTSFAAPHLKMYSGTFWVDLGAIDKANNGWEGVLGGGLASVTAAATVDLCGGGRSESYITITGTATIESFGASCAPGQMKLLNFSGVATLAHATTGILLPTGAPVTAQAGDQVVVVYTGAAVWRVVSWQRADGSPLTQQTIPPVHFAGEVILIRAASCPAPTIPEDGRTLSRATYAQLFARLGTAWGAGDGSTTFAIADSGGQFDRGWVPGQSVDSGRAFGTAQLDALQNHVHNVENTVASYFFNATGSGSVKVANSDSSTNSGPPIGSGVRTSTETRPKNITVLHCLFTADTP